MAASFLNNLHNYSVKIETEDIEIDIGSTFDDYKSFENFLHKRKHLYGERWVKSKNLKSVGKANKLIDNREKHFKESFCYAFVTLICYRGGTHRSTASKRKTSTKKLNCPATIKLKANRSLDKLVVTECVLGHNHELGLPPSVRYPIKWTGGTEIECSEVHDDFLVQEEASVTSTTRPDIPPSPNALLIDLFSTNGCDGDEPSVAFPLSADLLKSEPSSSHCDRSTNDLLLRLLDNRKDDGDKPQHFNYALTVAEKLDLLDLKTAYSARKEIDDILLKYILDTK